MYVSLLAAVGSGLYPLLFYFSNNYTLVNSWSLVGYFVSVFLLAPILVFLIAQWASGFSFLARIKKYIRSFLNMFLFLFFIKTAIYAGFQWVLVIGVVGVSAIYALMFHRYFLKVVVFQLLLAIVASFYLIPSIIEQLQYSREWTLQPDNIVEVQFKKKPNVYLIQPDGYVNFSELKRGFYNVKENKLERFLKEQSFTLYPNFRSNYASTLTSNSSLFTMKHHYYVNTSNFTEMLDARTIIMGNNPVLEIFKNNGYTNYFLAERPYLLVNKPKVGFDRSNYTNKDLSFITTGLEDRKDVMEPLRISLEEQQDTPMFQFIELFDPGHITVTERKSQGMQLEREMWLDKLDAANSQVITLVSLLRDKDPDAIIIIVADHGGFVGLEYMHQAYQKTQNRDKLYSIFGANLAIYWPEGPPVHNDQINTTVNVFRNLISYLSDDTGWLAHLENDSSYIPIWEGAPKGIYEVLDANGNIVFKKR